MYPFERVTERAKKVLTQALEAAQGFASSLKSAPTVPRVTLDRESIEVDQVMAHAQAD